MADQEEEDLQMALRMSMQSSPPEPKRSKPIDTATASPEESRRRQRELMAIAAEKRMMAGKFASPSDEKLLESEEGVLGRELSTEEANELFLVVFGNSVSKDILAQWCNQGIRFSPDPETCMGLVQHEGGPCGVLATIQAFVLKYLLFSPDGSGQAVSNMLQNLASERISKSNCLEHENLGSLDEGTKTRALIKSLSEILLLCGSNRRVVIATLKTIGHNTVGSEMDETVVKALEGLSIESGSDLKELLRVEAYTSQDIAMQKLQTMMPVFQSSMGALLFLISALLSRGLDNVQADRDDPSFPLVTAPFGHASQEIVNLLLCGQAVANVFDGSIDLGGGMFLKGIPSNVEVGFLTLLESLNFCKVGQHLKRPNWPIWVVGSESHYTVLFALKTSVQDENEAEERESQIRRAFDAQDQSGGGGFISVEGFHQVLREVNVELPPEKLDHLCSTGFIVWSDFWQAILDLEKSLGGLKHTSGLMGKKVFDLYHFNGIAKSNINGLNIAGETPVQKPRLTTLRVSVPPQWTPEEYMANESSSKGTEEATSSEPSQHAPLVDCIRTRWPRASCSWVGDPPSIV